MTDAQVAALSALGGALIGSFGGAVAAVLAFLQARDQRRAEDRRHMWRLGLELGAKEWETHVDYLKTRGGKVWPPQLSAYFSARFFQLAAEGQLTPATYEQLMKELNGLQDAVTKASKVE